MKAFPSYMVVFAILPRMLQWLDLPCLLLAKLIEASQKYQ